MDLLSQIVARAKSNKQRIVLPEAEEERTRQLPVTPCVLPCRSSSASLVLPASAVVCCSSLSRSSMVRMVCLSLLTWL